MADAIFAVRQRMEKQGKQDVLFIDLERHAIECHVKKYGGAIARRDCLVIM